MFIYGVLGFVVGVIFGTFKNFFTWQLPLPFFPLVILLVGAWVYKAWKKYTELFYPKKVKIKNNIQEYQKMRGSLRTGDVVAFSGNGLSPLLIKFGTSSEYSHVGLVVRVNMGDGKKRVFLIEADNKKGIVLVRLSRKLEYYNGSACLYRLDDDLTENKNGKIKEDIIYEYVMEQLGKGYDYPAIKGVVKTLLGFISLGSQDDGTFICSELVGRALQVGGYVDSAVNAESLSPKDITDLNIFEKKVRITLPF